MAWWSRLFRRRANSASDPRTDERRADAESRRRCAVESMEPRRLLAIAPINLGVTYIEEDTGADIHGDTFEVKFEGGAPLTQMTRLVIDTDQGESGYSVGDLLFDTEHSGYGADEAFPLTIVSKDGIGSVTWRVVDGGQKLEFDFVGFEAGDKLVFSIDVDEIQQFEPGQTVAKVNEGIDPIASGVEFQGSLARAEFAAPNYFDTASESTFRNVYDPLFAGTNLLRSAQNADGLPPDNWEGKRDRSTGVVVPATQQIMPASLCGAVYVDLNQNGQRDTSEAGIASVTIRAIPVNTIADQTVRTLQTDVNGQFCFEDLIPGEYRLEEDQPTGYFDGVDRAGTVDGETRGVAVNPGDRVNSIQLAGGDEGVDYLFGEIPPGSLTGQVMLTDPEGNCDGPLARPLEQVEIRLLRDGQLLATTTTNAEGRYEFTNLPPGVYSIVEVTPAGLIDGDEHVGSLGGTITADDTIAAVNLAPGQNGVEYDFCEHEPASLAGFVYHDQNEDGQFQSSETPIANTRVDLLNATGTIVASAMTDALGAYRFDQLPAGVYRLVEHQPTGWLDGRDTIGTVGGVATGTVASGGDDLREITLRWGDSGINYLFGELLPASLKGAVHANPDNTCMDESQATPLANVLLELLDAQGQVVQTTRTNAAGEYSFANLRPGTYSVRQAQPEQYFDGKSMAGSSGGDARPNLIDQVHLESGEDAVEYDFCELPPAQLAGQVFQDGASIETKDGLPPANLNEIRDGVRTADDRPLAGVTVELRDGVTGRPILGSEALAGVYAADQPIRAVTDAAGRYVLRGLAGDRSYAVYEIQPADLFDGIDKAGTSGGLAFNPGAAIPADVVAALLAPPGTDAIVRISLGYGQFSQENNFSEIQVTKAPEPPPEPPKPEPPRPEPPFIPPYFPATPPPTPQFIETLAFSPPPPQIPLLVPQVQPIPEIITGGSGNAGATWHLSVLDAGRPRGESARRVDLVKIDRLTPLLSRWRSQRMREAQWLVAVGIPHSEVPTLSEFAFGARGAIPVAGDFNGDGRTDLGVYVDGEWFLDVNGNGQWDSDDLWAQLGSRQDRPVVGDWNGDGKDDIGIFGVEWSGDYRQLVREPGLPDFRNEPKPVPKNIPPQDEEATDGLRFLQLTAQGDPRADLIDHVFRYGQTNDTPIAGDWDGDGIDAIGVYRDGRWRLDQNGDGRVGEQEGEFEFGRPGDTPVHGDFDGDGIDEIGVYRNGVWIIDMNHNHTLDAQDRVFEMGGAGDQPVVGDWDGDGSDEPGIFGKPQS
jgi:serine-aspartate repeat-containing protein C/D/E